MEVGETMVMERAYLSIMVFETGGGELLAANPINFTPETASGEFSFIIANNLVIKPIPILSWWPEFNAGADFDADNVFFFDTQLTLQPLLEFIANVRFNEPLAAGAGSDNHLRLTIEGPGSIIAPRTTF